jgi:hypothetical protein
MFQAFVEETGTDLRIHMNDIKKEIGNPISDIVDAYYICKFNYNNFSSSQ